MGTYIQEETSGSCGILSFSTDLSSSGINEQQRVWHIRHCLYSQDPHHILRIQGQDAHLHHMRTDLGCRSVIRESLKTLLVREGFNLCYCHAEHELCDMFPQATHRRIMRTNSQEAGPLVAFRDWSHINAGNAACNLFLFHLQQLPCLGELEVDDLTTSQCEDDLHIAEPFQISSSDVTQRLEQDTRW